MIINEEEFELLVRRAVKPLQQEVLDAVRSRGAGVMEDQMLSSKEAAKEMGFKPPAIRAWIDRGWLRNYGPGTRIRVLRSELYAAAARARMEPTENDIEDQAQAILKKKRDKRKKT